MYRVVVMPTDDDVGSGDTSASAIAHIGGESIQPVRLCPLSDNSPQGVGGDGGQQRHDQRPCAGREPSRLRQEFPNLIPSKPYCADRLSDGLVIRKKAIALQKRHLQLNGPSTFQWMAHDIDRPGAYFAHDDANLPPPNIIMVNRENGHAHSAYLMAVPIARHNFARTEPLRFFAAVERGVARRLEADRFYSGLIAKNPMHDYWMVEWRREEPYTLSQLEDNLFERDMRSDPTPETTFGAGRNVTVFDELRAIAYREVREYKRDGAAFDAWLQRCLSIALDLNRQFPQAMKLSECRAIAKSVGKWTWARFSMEKFIARQRCLGAKGNAIRSQRRWAGHESVEKLKPWVKMGISRATYYRRMNSDNVDETLRRHPQPIRRK